MMIYCVADNSSWLESLVQLICTILIFIFVVALAYFAARVAGSFQSNIATKQTNIKIIETYRITNNKFIQIVKLGDKYVALGVGKDEVNLIAELNPDSINDMQSPLTTKIDFKDVLAKIRKDNNNKE